MHDLTTCTHLAVPVLLIPVRHTLPTGEGTLDRLLSAWVNARGA